ncbi:HAMP domain-containing sensor histidine kinase [Branchiibius sp. NY16-3462-2]|uniref:sensor histidine kinase n=1 Tax=Branchiibius sp. NY16-3462-2 TaxID=1807500 RepID=UPI00079A5BF1|nr:HAMP domain-containing sensor histidine kinase [Branchiibius sp. NY16-3462-2]KYH43002.1 hypothetical protein AZH51_06005 [Branchiibius sp. NY16-3462-2]
MRRRLTREGLLSLTCAGLPPTAAGIVIADNWPTRVTLLAIGIVSFCVACWLTVRSVDWVTTSVNELVRRAEDTRVGSSGPPLNSGVEEFDRIAAVFEHRAASLSRSIAAERDFAADASHQLRTPLTALMMRLDEISETDDIDLVHEEALVAIEQVERLTEVVEHLLHRTRTQDDEPAESVSLDSVIAALQREWQPAFTGARRAVRVTGQRGLQVLCARGDLAQVLSTLLENALTHGAGTVEVRARSNGPSVVVEVSDHGPGVDAALAPRIFERRVSTGGTGLGLALARDLAAANGGRLELRSAHPAVFALFLSESRS